MKQTFKFTKYIVVMVMVGLMLGSGFLTATASKNAPVQMVPQNFSALADTVSPAVVHIRVEKTVKGGGPAFHQFGQKSTRNHMEQINPLRIQTHCSEEGPGQSCCPSEGINIIDREQYPAQRFSIVHICPFFHSYFAGTLLLKPVLPSSAG